VRSARKRRPAASGTLAVTGPPVLELLLLGLACVITGGSTLLAAHRRASPAMRRRRRFTHRVHTSMVNLPTATT